MRTGALNKLTARGVAAAKDGMHSDGGGLYLRVKGASRVWVFRFTHDGRKREMGMGRVALVSLASAREKAAAAREQVGQGIDPIASKPAPAPVPQPVSRSVTFADAMRKYIRAHHQTWSNAKHSAQWESSLESYAGSIMRKPVADITTADVETLLAPIWLTKIETASRVRQRVERILSASIARGDRPGPNPAALRDNFEHILSSQKKLKQVKHHAAVPWQDAPAAFQSILARRAKGIGYQALITVCFTACRSGEVRHLQWDDVQDDTLSIPAARMKARRDHRVPISGPLAAHLSALPHIAGTPLIHSGTGGKPMSDMTMAKALRNAGWPDATPHGWRSTFSDWANAEGWSRDLIEDQLAHQIGSGVERAYRRSDYLDRRRPLMDAWAAYLESGL